MLINSTTQKKWANSLKTTNHQNSTDKLNSSKIIKEIGSVIKEFFKKNSPSPDASTGQSLFKHLTPILHKSFKKKKERTLPNLTNTV